MGDAGAMRPVQRVSDLNRDRERFRQRNGAAFEPLRQGSPRASEESPALH